MKKAISVFLSVLMVISILPAFTAFAYDSGSCGENLTWTLNNGAVTISGTGDMYSYGDNGSEDITYADSPFFQNENVNSVVFTDGVTSISSWSFAGCKNLESVEIADSVSKIDERAFIGCKALTSVVIPNGVKTIGRSVFFACDNLESVVLSNRLKAIASKTFGYCKNLKSIEIPEGVKTIYSYAFTGCDALSDVTFPSTLETISKNAFANCGKMTDVEFPVGLNSIGDLAFARCKKLTHLTIPENVSFISELAFRQCEGLTSICVDSNNATFDSRSGCNAIIKTDENKLLLGCKNTVIPHGITIIGMDAFNGCSGLTSIEIPKSVVEIKQNGFSNCTGLSSIEIPKSVTKIGAYAFINCTGLNKVDIPDSVTEIYSYCFANCTGITKVTISAGLKTLYHGLFYGCTGLKEVVIPKNITKIRRFVFGQCTGLEKISIPNSVTIIEEGAFKKCSSLKSVKLPNKLTKISNGLFSDCTALKTITIPKKVNKIEYNSFYNCSSLTKFVVASENEYYTAKKGVLFDADETVLKAYPCNKSAASYTIPYGIDTIRTGAFENCAKLKKLTISESVTKIEGHAFGDESSLKTIRYRGSFRNWKAINIERDLDGSEYYNEIYDETNPKYKDNYYLDKEPDMGMKYVYTSGNDVIDNAKIFCTNGMLYKDHKCYSKDAKVTKQPTFTATGKKVYKCSHCSKKFAITLPKLGKVKLSKVTRGKKSFTAKWAKVANVDGYQIQYSTYKSMKNAKKVRIKGNKTFKKTVKNLSSGKKYYVRIRAFKKINGKTGYSDWSAKKAVTVK